MRSSQLGSLSSSEPGKTRPEAQEPRTFLWIALPRGVDSVPAVTFLESCGIQTLTPRIWSAERDASPESFESFLSEFLRLLPLYFGADFDSPAPLDFHSLPASLRSELEARAMRGAAFAGEGPPLAIIDPWAPFLFEFWSRCLERRAAIFWVTPPVSPDGEAESVSQDGPAEREWTAYWADALRAVDGKSRIVVDGAGVASSESLAGAMRRRLARILHGDDVGTASADVNSAPDPHPSVVGTGQIETDPPLPEYFQVALAAESDGRTGDGPRRSSLQYDPEALARALPGYLAHMGGHRGLCETGFEGLEALNHAWDLRFEEFRNEIKWELSQEREGLTLAKRQLRRLTDKLRKKEDELRRKKKEASRSGFYPLKKLLLPTGKSHSDSSEPERPPHAKRRKGAMPARSESESLEQVEQEIEKVSIFGASPRLQALLHSRYSPGGNLYASLAYLRSHTGFPGLNAFPSDEELKLAPDTSWVDAWYRQNQALRVRPRISVVIPIHATPPKILTATLQSVLDQVYGEWELCLAVDAATGPETDRVVAGIERRFPDRVRCVRLDSTPGIVGSSNAAAALATGEFVALLDHDDLITPDALLEVAMAVNGNADVDFIYSDEDKVTFSGDIGHTFWKPDFAPEMLDSFNYITHFSVIRRSLFEEIGGFREGFDGSQDHDLILRATERSQRIVHIPKPLYHWRMIPGSTSADFEAKGEACRAASVKALEDAVARRGERATVELGRGVGTYRVRYVVDPEAAVTIMIPTRDNWELLKQCVESIHALSTHRAFEILVIANNSEKPETLAYLDEAAEKGELRYIRHDIPFNYSALNNFAVRNSDRPYLLFLNDDTKVISPDWIEALLEHAQRKPIGVVGARLLFEDRTLQHAGLILGGGGIASHAFRGDPEDSTGYFNYPIVVRNCSAVTGACMMIRREIYEEVGGMDEALACAFNDVDLCLRVMAAGYRNLYTPYAELFHFESKTRGYPDNEEKMRQHDEEVAFVYHRWKESLFKDPNYNPNLTLVRKDYSPKTPMDRSIEALFRLQGSEVLRR